MTRVIVLCGDRERCSGGERGDVAMPYTVFPHAEPAKWKGRLFNGELWVYDRRAPKHGMRIVVDPVQHGWRLA